MLSDIPDNEFWNRDRSQAAMGLAEGRTQLEVAERVGVTDRTLRYWLLDPRFTAEIDRLSLMIGIASRAERLRWVARIARQRVRADGEIVTEKDLLDWFKFAQSETDGAKIDLSKLTDMLIGEESSPLSPVIEGGHNSSLSLATSPLEKVIDVPQEQPTATDDGERD